MCLDNKNRVFCIGLPVAGYVVSTDPKKKSKFPQPVIEGAAIIDYFKCCAMCEMAFDDARRWYLDKHNWTILKQSVQCPAFRLNAENTY